MIGGRLRKGPPGPRPKPKTLQTIRERASSVPMPAHGITAGELAERMREAARAAGLPFEEQLNVTTRFDGRWLVDGDSIRMFGLVRPEDDSPGWKNVVAARPPTHAHCRCSHVDLARAETDRSIGFIFEVGP